MKFADRTTRKNNKNKWQTLITTKTRRLTVKKLASDKTLTKQVNISNWELSLSSVRHTTTRRGTNTGKIKKFFSNLRENAPEAGKNNKIVAKSIKNVKLGNVSKPMGPTIIVIISNENKYSLNFTNI